MRFKKDHDEQRHKFADWLLSLNTDAPSDWRMNHWKGSKRRVGSPLHMFYGEIERFSFDRGAQFSLPKTSGTEPRSMLLSQVVKANRLNAMAPFLFERGAVTGSTLLVYRPDPEKFYEILSYENQEFMALDDGFAVQYHGVDGYWVRWAITSRAYEYYEPTKFPASPWKLKDQYSHAYGEVPAIEIGHRFTGHTPKPAPAFDWVALELAAEIISQTLASASAFNYMGAPLLVSADPRQTIEELAGRARVLSGANSPDFQDTAMLAGGGMPAHHEEFIDRLGKNYADHMRINWVPSDPPGDTSSLTLRLLYSKTIQAADRVADTYLGGLSKVLGMVLKAAALDGVLADVTPTQPETHEVRFDYEQELFPPTPQEKTALLAVAESLIQLGIRPQVALQEYYGSHTEEEIDALLYGA